MLQIKYDELKRDFQILQHSFHKSQKNIKALRKTVTKLQTQKEKMREFKTETNLVHLCAAAKKVILLKHHLFPVKDRPARLKEVKQLQDLIKEHFTTDVSSIALKDMNEKKME